MRKMENTQYYELIKDVKLNINKRLTSTYGRQIHDTNIIEISLFSILDYSENYNVNTIIHELCHVIDERLNGYNYEFAGHWISWIKIVNEVGDVTGVDIKHMLLQNTKISQK